jgi:hypothetical protein
MAGQPTYPIWLTFSATGINFNEAGSPPSTLPPSNIVPKGSTFSVDVTFEGSGLIFAGLEATPGVTYTVDVSAESFSADGGPTYEGRLGLVTGNLASGGSPYTATVTVASGKPSGPSQDGNPVAPDFVLPPGLYKVTAVVQLSAPWNFVVGYFESPVLLQIYE